jgi:hypothetical protein
MLLEEYRRSLKMPEAEEVFDLLVYRPLAFAFVKAAYRLPVTPNQVTLLSMLAGLASAWYFSLATSAALVWAAVWYGVANILDCSDGQLARLQNSGTLLGRVIDGVADYVASVAVFLGIGFGLSAPGHQMWWLVVAAGLSSALHAASFDHYQSEFISTVRGERNFLEREIEKFSTEIRLRQHSLTTAILKLYLAYLDVQKRSTTKAEQQTFRPEDYRSKNLTMIRLWSFLGPTTNRTLLIVCALAGGVEAFLWIIVSAGNAWLVACYVRQRRIHRTLESAAG